MIDTILPNIVDASAINLGPDSYFEYVGSISIASDKFGFPGAPLTKEYTHLKFGNYVYKIVNIDGAGVTVDRYPGPARTFVGKVSLGYAVDDGRNLSNWHVNDLSLKSVSPGRMEFNENLRVMKLYRATLLHDVEDSIGGVLPAGTSFTFRTKINADPAKFIEYSVSDGVIQLRFNRDLLDTGIIDGVPIDRYEIDGGVIYIYTPYIGDAELEISGFTDIFGNPMDDLSIDVSISAENQIFEYSDSTYRMKYRGRYDFEDFISTEAQKWLYQKQDLE